MGGLSGSSRPSGRLRLGGLSRLGGLILLTALLLPGGLLLLNAPGHAQTRDAAPAPPTSAEWAVDGLLEPPSMRPLPPLPEGYRAQESGGQRWISHARAAEPVEALREEFAAIWIEVCEELGVELEANVEIRVARNPEEMRQLAPSDAPPPEYAVGVAYPSRGLILLTLTAPSSWERPAMGSVLEHEIS
ncbi:MAG: hypothetical protein OEY14_14730, partial [Myxococcales bacterium]|nr:hypothetical protein [Myxococcales bacterium]